MNTATYRAGIIGLGFIGAADQTSGDALGQQVENLDGTHLFAESLQVLESIVAFHASHDRSGAWTELPLQGEDRNRLLNSG